MVDTNSDRYGATNTSRSDNRNSTIPGIEIDIRTDRWTRETETDAAVDNNSNIEFQEGRRLCDKMPDDNNRIFACSWHWRPPAEIPLDAQERI